VPLVDHADGIPSLILGARDASALRRLEVALQESEAIRQKLAAQPPPRAIENVSVEVKELQAKLDEAEADRDRLERALSRLPQLEQLLKQGKTHLQDLRTRLEEATSERNRLEAQLNEREAANEQLWGEQAELERALADRQQRELDELQGRLLDANATRDAVAARLHAREIEHDQLIEASRQELSVLQRKLDEAISEKDQLVTQLADRISEHERALTEQDDRHRFEGDEHRKALDALRAEMDQTAGERDALHGQVTDLKATYERSVIERSELNQLLDDHRRQLVELRTQLDEAAADRDRFEEQLRDAEAYCQQLSNDHLAQKKAAEKSLADHRIEVQSMDVAARRLEPMAAAGRLALDLARELVTAVADIDARAACLVAESPVDSSNREQAEQLRADAVRVASLARQILHASHINQSEERK
jgi:chromosome segregation ATPase